MNRSQPTSVVPFDVKLMNITATVMFMGCLAACVMTVGWWLMRTPAFNIGRIVVEGELVHNNAVTLRANVAPVLKGNFFTVDLKAAQHAFEQVPWVREAQVRREYPNSLRVILHEHEPQAYWGPETGTAMVNTMGEVFEANVGEVDQKSLPRLNGPQGHGAEVLAMYRALAPLFEKMGTPAEELELSVGGSWRAQLEGGASVELGRGSVEDLSERVNRFLATLTQVTSRYGRQPSALESVDLRHENGYAIRLRGVSTVAAAVPKK